MGDKFSRIGSQAYINYMESIRMVIILDILLSYSYILETEL